MYYLELVYQILKRTYQNSVRARTINHKNSDSILTTVSIIISEYVQNEIDWFIYLGLGNP